MAKKDIRSLNTHRILIDAMIKLLETKEFDDITVNDICITSSVSRTTFYLHFEDKYSLMSATFDFLIRPENEIYKEEDIEIYFDNLLSAKMKNSKFMKKFIRIVNDELKQKIKEKFLESFKILYKNMEANGFKSDISCDLAAIYNYAGINSLILWWIENNFSIPKETMVSILSQRTRQIFSS